MTYSLQPGTDVEVKSTFDRNWKRGFVIEGACEQGYHLRRQSDGSVLPAAFPEDAVRPADVAPAPAGLPR
ncbi:MAG: hypothetical protein M3Q68_06460 [Actinomycetota bacterium]|nr:hypothetical protein [Actinomycetota bacterium]